MITYWQQNDGKRFHRLFAVVAKSKIVGKRTAARNSARTEFSLLYGVYSAGRNTSVQNAAQQKHKNKTADIQKFFHFHLYLYIEFFFKKRQNLHK